VRNEKTGRWHRGGEGGGKMHLVTRKAKLPALGAKEISQG